MATPNPTDSSLQTGTPDANLNASPAGGQPNSQGTPPTLEQYRLIAREEAEKAWQVGKDRRFSKIENEQVSQRTLLDQVQAKMDETPGMTIAQARREVKLDQLLADPEPAQPVSQGSGTPPAAETVKRLIDKFSMDMNDPEVIKAIRENSDTVDLSFALAGLQVTRKTSPTPNLATNASPAGGGSVGGGLSQADTETKAGQLDLLLREPTKNARAIAALQKELGPDYA